MTRWRAIFLSFGAVFTLWLLSAYALVLQVDKLRVTAVTAASEFDQLEELLLALRDHVLMYPPGAIDAAQDTVRFGALGAPTRRSIDEAIQRRVDLASGRERDLWRQMQHELDRFRAAKLASRPSGVGEAQAVVGRRPETLTPNSAIFDVAAVIRALQRDSSQLNQAQVVGIYQSLRNYIWATSGGLAVVGLVIAIAASGFVRALDTRIHQQHRQEVARKVELQELAKKLVHVQEQERQSLARELHDEVGQALTAINMELSAAERHLRGLVHHETPAGEPDPDTLHERLGDPLERLHEAGSIVERTLQTVRDRSRILHPSMLDDLGLAETLRWYLRGFSQRTGVRARLVLEDFGGTLTSELQLCAYRIVQEALTNIARHADATSCIVHLRQLPGSLVLEVEDDGKGIEREGRQSDGLSQGLGLVSIRERVAGFGGTFRIERGLTKGTRLTIACPIRLSSPEASSAPAQKRG